VPLGRSGKKTENDKQNGAYQLQVYTDDDLPCENINTTKRITQAVTGTSKDVGLEVNVQKTGQSHNIRTG
jgi:hypothetical protein